MQLELNFFKINQAGIKNNDNDTDLNLMLRFLSSDFFSGNPINYANI